LRTLGQELGELRRQRGTLTNCGVQHTQSPITRETTLDHIDLLSKLRAIEHPHLATGTGEAHRVEALHQLFISLLGAIAYATHTRVVVMVLFVALQRRHHNPQAQHVRKLNKLL